MVGVDVGVAPVGGAAPWWRAFGFACSLRRVLATHSGHVSSTFTALRCVAVATSANRRTHALGTHSARTRRARMTRVRTRRVRRQSDSCPSLFCRRRRAARRPLSSHLSDAVGRTEPSPRARRAPSATVGVKVDEIRRCQRAQHCTPPPPPSRSPTPARRRTPPPPPPPSPAAATSTVPTNAQTRPPVVVRQCRRRHRRRRRPRRRTSRATRSSTALHAATSPR